jgi:plastocyanin
MKEYKMSDKVFLKFPVTIMVISLIIVIVGCGKNKSTNPNNTPIQHSSHYHAVSIQGFAFSPAASPIAAGDTIQWTNNDSAPHTVTSDSGTELNSSSLGQGQSYLHVFAHTGAFPYHCAIHTSMHGAVTVQ